MGIGVVTADKVGIAVASGLRAAGHAVIGAYAASETELESLEVLLPGVPTLEMAQVVERAELVILPADGVAELAAANWQPGQIVMHTAPGLGTEVLAPAAARGAIVLALHPNIDFTGTSLDVARLSGAYCALSAANTVAPIGIALASELGATAVLIPSELRPRYAAVVSKTREKLREVVQNARGELEELGAEDMLGAIITPILGAAGAFEV